MRYRIRIGLALGSVVLVTSGACRRAEAPPPPPPPPTTVAATAPSPVDVAIPLGQPLSPQELERQRFNEEWLRLQSFPSPAPAASGAPASSEVPAPGASPAPAAASNVTFSTSGRPETLKGLDPASLETLPVRVPIKGDQRGPSVLRTQVRLDRTGFSPGIVDGRWGKNSQIAVYWFQRQNGLPATGVVDEATFRAIAASAGDMPTLLTYTVTDEDAKGPFTTIPTDVYAKEKLDCLCYEDLLEALSERFHTTREFLEAVNGPTVRSLAAGQTLRVPNVPEPAADGAKRDVKRIVVSVGGNYVNGLDDGGRIVFHAPTTVGSKYDPSPDEALKVTNVAWNPDFHYQPTLFHEVPDSDAEAHLKPGPNSPVGVVWMALSREHFGIHGTGDPDSIGYASSHGCVRLTNWDAKDLGHRIEPGVPVEFVDTRGKPKTASR